MSISHGNKSQGTSGVIISRKTCRKISSNAFKKRGGSVRFHLQRQEAEKII